MNAHGLMYAILYIPDSYTTLDQCSLPRKQYEFIKPLYLKTTPFTAPNCHINCFTCISHPSLLTKCVGMQVIQDRITL